MERENLFKFGAYEKRSIADKYAHMAAAVGPIKIFQRKSMRIKFQKKKCLSNDIQNLQVYERQREREKDEKERRNFLFHPKTLTKIFICNENLM